MSIYQHRRNFSLLTTQSQNHNKIKPKNNSLRKMQTNNNYSWLLISAKQYYHKTNNLTAAIQNFEQYLTIYPNHQQSLYLCSVCYMNIGQYNKAIEKLKQYLTTKKNNNIGSLLNNRKLIINNNLQLPNTSHVYLLLSMAYNKLNNITKSLQNINQSLRNDNKYQPAFCFRAKLYIKINQDQKAFYDYKQVLKLNPMSWTAWVGLGDYYTHVNNYVQALKCYEKAEQSLENDKKIQKNKLGFQQIDPQTKYKLEKPLTNQRQNRTKFSNMGVSKYIQKFSQKRDSRIHEKLKQFIKKPKQRSYKQISLIQKQQQNELKQKPKFKLTLRSLTSPQCDPSLIRNIFPQQQQQQKKVKFFQVKQQKYSKTQQIGQKYNQFQISQQIQLKISICYYFLSQYNRSIGILQKMLADKVSNFYTEIYYYLAVNQLKIYQQSKINKNYPSSNSKIGQLTKITKQQPKSFHKKPNLINAATSSTTSNNIQPTLHLTIKQPLILSSSQILHQSILNLQSSIRSNNNKKIMIKACKALIKLYIQNNQFYETDGILKLAQKYEIDLKQYKILSQVCMMVIKKKYQQALPILKRLYQSIIKNTNKLSPKKQYKQQIQSSKRNKIEQRQKIGLKKQQKTSKTQYLQSYKNNSSRQIQFYQYSKQFQQIKQQKQSTRQRQKLIKSTGHQRNSNNNNHDNNHDKYSYYQENNDQLILSNQFKNLTIKTKIQSHKLDNYNLSSTSNNQLDWMKPVILLFRAYSQYFSDNFIECLQIYEHYENYIKDYLGLQPQMDMYISYNKILCQGILMLDNEMIQESLSKFMYCVENYYKLLNSVAVQPILFRILGMIRLAISDNPILSEQINSRYKVYQLIVEIFDHYMPAINTNPLVHYYYSLALYQLGRYKEASDSLEKCLKLAQQCTWKFLYVKGIVQIKNKLYKDAIRQFSAGLLVQEKSQIYLGRCICYLQLFDESEGEHQAYMEKSFQDLQKFIQLEENKDKISKWVTKLLFFNKAYEEVTKSIRKVPNNVIENDEDLIAIQKCLNIFNGLFESGGVLGQILMNAFEGKFDENSIQINGQRHQINFTDFMNQKYKKWLIILNFYSCQRYSELIKFLQLTIFQQKFQEQATQLRYNLAMIYYLSKQPTKADNILAGLPKICKQMGPRVQKFLNRDFVQDQCIDDLQKQYKGVKRLSGFLNYRNVLLSPKASFSLEAKKSIYVKISVPFPVFFKPDIQLSLDDLFIYGETAQTCIQKKIEAPWIKKVTGNVQFTDNVISSHNTSIFDNDLLSPGTESKQQSSSSLSSIKNY